MLEQEPETQPGYPCIFKSVCMNCSKATLDERPPMCIQLKCQSYTPCPECGRNVILHDSDKGKLCRGCLTKKKTTLKNREGKLAAVEAQSTGAVIKSRGTQMTSPGTPPPGLNEQEAEHYMVRWEEYKGHYRNPAAYFVCHFIILQEIHTQYLLAKLVESRGYQQEELTKELESANKILSSLFAQLPEKEAQDLMDDEKSLAMIYDAYIKEKKVRYANGVARLLSPEAIALAPQLHFPIDPVELIHRLGFTTVESIDVASQATMPPEEYTADEVMEYFGFQIREEYAMPLASPVSDSQLAADEEEGRIE